jgi:hypothetical protein
MNGDLKLVNAPDLDPDEELLATLRLDPAQTEAAVRVPITLQCRKPPKHEFIRVRPDLELTVSAIELRDDADGGFDLVAAPMAAALSDEPRDGMASQRRSRREYRDQALGSGDGKPQPRRLRGF